MQRTIRTCVYSSEEQGGGQIVETLKEAAGVQVVSEATSAGAVHRSVEADAPDMILINLDPDLEGSLAIVHDVLAASPGIGIIGVSGRKDPETIIKAMRAGCTQFVCAPIEIEDLRGAISRITVSKQPSAGPTSKCICVIGSGGGVGTTTLACNLALELANVTRRASALIDLDLDFGDVAACFDATPTYTLGDICEANAELDETSVASALETLPCNVHLLARPVRLGDAHMVCPDAVARMLGVLRTRYANVVVDLPRIFNTVNAAAVQRADLILIVAQLRVATIRNAHRVFELLLQMGAEEDRIELVLNRSNAAHDHVSAENVESSMGHSIFAQIPNDYRNVAKALDLGRPIKAKAPRSPARHAIHELARNIAKVNTDDREGKTGGIFKRLWAKKAATT